MNELNSVLTCKACGKKSEVKQDSLMPYPNGEKSINPLGLTKIATCVSCDFGQALPEPTQAELERYYSSGQYWEEYKENRLLEAHQKVQAEIRLSAVQRFLPQARDIRVLDIGAGLGFLGDEFANWSMRTNGSKVFYCAVEPDVPTAKRVYERLSSKEVSCKVVSSLAEASDQFDIIFLNHVLEHVLDPVAFLKEVGSRLRGAGVLYVEVPHRDDRFKVDVFPHLQFFSLASLRLVGERAGFDVSQTEAFGVSLGAPKSVIPFFIRRVRRGIWGRIFNFAAKRGWIAVYIAADRKLYHYGPNPNGCWLQGIFFRSVSDRQMHDN